ncbi:MAG TPA: hypothetical protein VJ642_09005, partial [Chromobacteriaceae bacterium]|nr:hypothetical protein [Chromobacteriaceae bacterium]
MTLALSLVVLALKAASSSNAQPLGAEAAGRVAFADVCLGAIAGGRPVADLAQASGMEPVSPTALGGTDKDKAWRVGLLEPAYVVAWNDDGGCTAIVNRGDPAALSAMARAA